MEAPNIRGRIGRIGGSSQLLTSRRGALSVAGLSAVLAGILIYFFVQHYRQAPLAPAAPPDETVFVASQYIPVGMPEALVAQDGYLRRTEVPPAQVIAGAISDPSVIAGEVANEAVAAGQQVTAAEFTHAAISIGANLTKTDRAIALALSAPHGLTDYLIPGATVDVLIDRGGHTEMLAQNVSVLANDGGDVVLNVSDYQAMLLAGASDADTVWLLLRPAKGAQQSVRVYNEVADP